MMLLFQDSKKQQVKLLRPLACGVVVKLHGHHLLHGVCLVCRLVCLVCLVCRTRLSEHCSVAVPRPDGWHVVSAKALGSAPTVGTVGTPRSAGQYCAVPHWTCRVLFDLISISKQSILLDLNLPSFWYPNPSKSYCEAPRCRWSWLGNATHAWWTMACLF